jgi:ribonuclease T1
MYRFGMRLGSHLIALFVLVFSLASMQVAAGELSPSGKDAIGIIAVANLPAEARDTLQAIKRGGSFAYPRDGVVFKNYERILPIQVRGCTSDTLLTKSAACGRRCEAGAPAPKGSAPPCRARYREYTVKTPGARNRGARRIISGRLNEYYYTADHYKTFKRILE